MYHARVLAASHAIYDRVGTEGALLYTDCPKNSLSPLLQGDPVRSAMCRANWPCCEPSVAARTAHRPPQWPRRGPRSSSFAGGGWAGVPWT